MIIKYKVFSGVALGREKPNQRQHNHCKYAPCSASDSNSSQVLAKSSLSDEKVKNLTLMLFSDEIYESLKNKDFKNPKLQYLLKEISDSKTRDLVFSKAETAVEKFINEFEPKNFEEDYLKNNLIHLKNFITITTKELNKSENENYKSVFGKVGAGKTNLQTNRTNVANSPQTLTDAIIMQAGLQSMCANPATKLSAVAATQSGSSGAIAGAILGYAGTLLAWGGVRNKIVDKIME